MNILKIKKVDFSKIKKEKVLVKYFENQLEINKYIKSINEPRYLYWDEAQYKVSPEGFSKEEFWWLVKQLRKTISEPLVIKSESGDVFTWSRQKKTDELLHKIDMHTGGQIFAPYEVLSKNNKQKFLARGILEEAIASSQLEGANTTRKAAKKMILENRQPKNRSEQMIVNNFNTMKLLEEDYKERKLSLDVLFEIHASLTKNDLPEDERFRLRKDSDDIVVSSDKEISHIPPKEVFLNKEIEKLIDYANNDEEFVHPVVKAIFLHFWIGYLHPFTDGNGRLARAIFYWYLLRKKYWTMMYLPISSIIKKSPVQYGNAYIYSEQDDLDLTYFFDYHIRKIDQAIDEFLEYIERKIGENQAVDILVSKNVSLNERQKQTLHYLLEEGEGAYTTVISHCTVNSVARITGSKDLKNLEKNGYLSSKKIGKFVRYYLTNKHKV